MRFQAYQDDGKQAVPQNAAFTDFISSISSDT